MRAVNSQFVQSTPDGFDGIEEIFDSPLSKMSLSK